MISPLEIAAILLFGALASGFGTMIGFGGGIFMVPLMVVVLGIPMPFVVGACAAAILPASLMITIRNVRERTVDLPVAIALELPTMVGVFVGSKLTQVLPVRTLESVFALFVIALGLRMLFSKRSSDEAGLVARLNQLGPRLTRQREGETYTVGVGAAALFGSLSGVAAGMFGVGGGFLKTPIMIRVFGMPAQRAIATALATIVSTSFFSTVSHAALGHIRWEYTVPTVIGFLVGASSGKRLMRLMGKTPPERLIAAGLFLAGLAILIHVVVSS